MASLKELSSDVPHLLGNAINIHPLLIREADAASLILDYGGVDKPLVLKRQRFPFFVVLRYLSVLLYCFVNTLIHVFLRGVMLDQIVSVTDSMAELSFRRDARKECKRGS